jgi:hypothetical protein
MIRLRFAMEMKKGLTILFLLLYSFSVFGIGLKEIYCCGKLKTVTVAVTVTENHKCNKHHKHKACCQSKYHYLKVKGNYLAAIATPIAAKPSIEVHSFDLPLWQPFFCCVQPKPLVGSHAPPLHNGMPIHIYNCVYRI